MGNNKISQLQLISMGVCYLLGTIVVAVFISAVALNEAWLIGILGGLFFLPVMLTYISLIKRYPGKNLFQMNEAVFGSVVGRIVSLVYLVFFMTLCGLNLLEASNFLHYFMMEETPLIFIAALLMIACVYCVKKGIAPIARVSTVFGLIALAGLTFNILFSFGHSKLYNLFPIFNLKLLDYVQSTHIAASIPFGESLFLLMFNSELSKNASMKKVYIAVTAVTAIIITVVHLREATALGSMISYSTMPSYEAVRMINLSSFLSRIESLFSLLLIALTFFKILILFYISANGLAQVLRLKSYRHLTVMLAAFLSIYAVEAYGSPSNNIFWGKNVSPFIWSFFTFLIPLITLASSLLKSLFKNKQVKS